MFGASSEPASVMEFGFNQTTIVMCAAGITLRVTRVNGAVGGNLLFVCGANSSSASKSYGLIRVAFVRCHFVYLTVSTAIDGALVR